MSTRIRLEPKASIRTALRNTVIKIVAGGVALSLVIFLGVFAFNYFGFQESSQAGTLPGKRYPFDISSAPLKSVNFTVLPEAINSDFEEVRPLIAPQGNVLFFSRRKHPGNVLAKRDKQDIWFTTLQADGQWTEPENLSEPINGPTADGVCSVSPDGHEIVFMHEEMEGIQPLFRSKRSGAGWATPEQLTIDEFYNKSDYIDAYYSFETRVLLMALSRDDSRGEQDLYVCFPASENKWQAPVNLGPVINSFDADFAPFLAADGRTLYFASYGHKGFGGCDIYQTTRLDDTWTRWSKPKNLGEGINSAREESYFSITRDNQYIYFESYDLKREVRDIFRANLPEQIRASHGTSHSMMDRSRPR